MKSSQPLVLRVALAARLDRLFDYFAPEITPTVSYQPGQRVLVLFGKRRCVAVIIQVVKTTEVPRHKMKSVLAVLDDLPMVPAPLLKLYQWASRYYHYPLGEIILMSLPKLLRQGKSLIAESVFLIQATPLGLDAWQQLSPRANKQKALMQLLAQQAQPFTKLKKLGFSSAVLQALEQKAWIEKIQQASEDFMMAPKVLEAPLNLNPQQQKAVSAITQTQEFQTFLLAGVTGSGKTEVYLHCIAACLKAKRQALILVPEIALTPQTLARFSARFDVNIVQLHSELTDKQRALGWLAAQKGDAQLIIGTRSAIFAPLQNLGIIILDEEHDLSFKQQSGFRYFARDVAVMRAKIENIPIILGSATPSLESYYNVWRRRYHLLKLPKRAGVAKPPKMVLLDICNQKLMGGLSPSLIKLIQQHLQQQGQVLLFLNRRGFAPVMMCHSCGWVAQCQYCDARLTLHRKARRLDCHHCDRHIQMPELCPQCQQPELFTLGLGTERIEQSLQQQFPQYKVLRVDRDSTAKKGSLNKMLSAIQAREAQILIGTQMLAKGHHFPHLSLVVIVDADSALFSADFRAIERMAQTLIQVSGRAGREARKGEVVIQTHHPQHPLLQLLITQGYSAFAKEVLLERQTAKLPPYAQLALLRAESEIAELPMKFLQQARILFKENKSSAVNLLGPIPSPMEKRAGRYRAQLLLQADLRSSLKNLLDEVMPELVQCPLAKKTRWFLDIDPQDLL